MSALILRHITPTKWWQRAQWELQQPLRLVGIEVPAYFITDGISTPWLVSWLVSPTGKGMQAAVLHDYLLSLLLVGESRYGADAAFYEALQACGVATWRARCMFIAVRTYAWLKGAY